MNSSRLPEPIFTPSTKAEIGDHDENISFDKTAELIGLEDANAIKDLTLAIYDRAAEHARERGIIIADTKLEFGKVDGTIILSDEVLTPDSSRSGRSIPTSRAPSSRASTSSSCAIGSMPTGTAVANRRICRRCDQGYQRKVHSGLREDHGKDLCSPVTYHLPPNQAPIPIRNPIAHPIEQHQKENIFPCHSAIL